VRIRGILPKMPIIISTGFSDILSSEKVEELGFQGFLQKPTSINDFSEILNKVFQGGKFGWREFLAIYRGERWGFIYCSWKTTRPISRKPVFWSAE